MSNSFATLWTVAFWAPLSMEFSRQEYWSGLLFPSPGDLPNPGIKCASLASPVLQADSLLLRHQGSPIIWILICFFASGLWPVPLYSFGYCQLLVSLSLGWPWLKEATMLKIMPPFLRQPSSNDCACIQNPVLSPNYGTTQKGHHGITWHITSIYEVLLLSLPSPTPLTPF